MRKVGADFDLDAEAFRFFDLREGKVAGIEARVARVTFTGELSFEINVPARHGLAMWETLIEAGKEWDITPVGSEASMVLRLEKGFLIMGAESDGMTNPYDAAHGWVVNENKGDFIGKRSLVRDRTIGDERKQLVGLLPEDAAFVPPDGSPIVEGGGNGAAPVMVGHVTAGAYSPNLDRSIALALILNGASRKGETVTISHAGGTGKAVVTEPIFIDPKGERMRS
jgi:sarcosine oxidase subunit alpha